MPKVPLDKLPPAGSLEAGEYLSERLAFVESRRHRYPYITAVPIEDDIQDETFQRLNPDCQFARVPILIWQCAIWMFEKETYKDLFLLDRLSAKGQG